MFNFLVKHQMGISSIIDQCCGRLFLNMREWGKCSLQLMHVIEEIINHFRLQIDIVVLYTLLVQYAYQDNREKGL